MAKLQGDKSSGGQKAVIVVAGLIQAALIAGMAVLVKRKNSAWREAQGQIDALHAQLASRDAASAAYASRPAAAQDPAMALQLEELKVQLEGLKQQLNHALADRDSLQALLDERNGQLVEATARLTALLAPPARYMSDFKAAATAAAAERGVTVSTTADCQDLADVKQIGATFEQRLYRAAVGTYWELAHLTDDDLELALKLSNMQKLAISFDEMRNDARRLAEETNTVGAIWAGDVPDDFEPIPGIGKVFEQRLYNAGIRTYRDLANATADQLASICRPRKPLEPDFAGWIRQAAKLIEVRNG